MNKSHQAEPEIREDFQGRIEVFDQSIRSFEKRLRAVERRLSMEIPPGVQAGRIYSRNLSGFSLKETKEVSPHTLLFSHRSRRFLLSLLFAEILFFQIWFLQLRKEMPQVLDSVQYFLQASL